MSKAIKFSRCQNCLISYPQELVQYAILDGNGKYLCGICYLEISNKIHNLTRTKLNGPIAEQMRQEAIKWRDEDGTRAY
jgi:hypothetical protein